MLSFIGIIIIVVSDHLWLVVRVFNQSEETRKCIAQLLNDEVRRIFQRQPLHFISTVASMWCALINVLCYWPTLHVHCVSKQDFWS